MEQVADLQVQMNSQHVALTEIREMLESKRDNDYPRKKLDMKDTPQKSSDKSSDLGQSDIEQA